jgi:hypothetical protein
MIQDEETMAKSTGLILIMGLSTSFSPPSHQYTHTQTHFGNHKLFTDNSSENRNNVRVGI